MCEYTENAKGAFSEFKKSVESQMFCFVSFGLGFYFEVYIATFNFDS